MPNLSWPYSLGRWRAAPAEQQLANGHNPRKTASQARRHLPQISAERPPCPGGRNHKNPKGVLQLDHRAPHQLGLFPNLPEQVGRFGWEAGVLCAAER